MDIRFKCPDCGKKLKVGEEHAGKQAKCPGCGNAVMIPPAAVQPQTADQPSTPTSSAPPPPARPEPVRKTPSETPVEYRTSGRRSSFLTGNALVLAKWGALSGVLIIGVVILVRLWSRTAEQEGITLFGGGNNRTVAADAPSKPNVAQAFAKLRAGMNWAEVTAIMGEPDEVTASEDRGALRIRHPETWWIDGRKRYFARFDTEIQSPQPDIAPAITSDSIKNGTVETLGYKDSDGVTDNIAAKLHRVSIGMTESDVIGVVGSPGIMTTMGEPGNVTFGWEGDRFYFAQFHGGRVWATTFKVGSSPQEATDTASTPTLFIGRLTPFAQAARNLAKSIAGVTLESENDYKQCCQDVETLEALFAQAGLPSQDGTARSVHESAKKTRAAFTEFRTTWESARAFLEAAKGFDDPRKDVDWVGIEEHKESVEKWQPCGRTAIRQMAQFMIEFEKAGGTTVDVPDSPSDDTTNVPSGEGQERREGVTDEAEPAKQESVRLGEEGSENAQESEKTPGEPLGKMSAELTCPLGVLVNVEFPKKVAREYAYTTEIELVDGQLAGESKWRIETYSASSKEKPIWLVFRAGDTRAKAISINEAEYTIKINGSVIKCLGADITEKDSAMAGYNIAYPHEGSRGYRRLLFVIPAAAKSITVQYQPKNAAGVVVSAVLPSQQ